MKMSDCVPVAHFFSWKYISVIHRFLDSLIQMIVHIITDDQIREFFLFLLLNLNTASLQIFFSDTTFTDCFPDLCILAGNFKALNFI